MNAQITNIRNAADMTISLMADGKDKSEAVTLAATAHNLTDSERSIVWVLVTPEARAVAKEWASKGK